MKTFDPSKLDPRQRSQFVLGTIGPRPIAFVSTLDREGRPNLAPYSFFNVFSSTPPVLIFSANSRVRDGKPKDTLQNIRETGELVINLVTYSMARQMALAGLDYEQGVNEFEKSGFTPLVSERVKPYRVKESPVHFECKILEIKALGDHPGAANLIIAEAVLIHLDERIIGPEQKIIPEAMELIGRLGGYSYARVDASSLFEVVQPRSELALGFDALPESVRKSSILSGQDLALLAGQTQWPSQEEVEAFAKQSAMAGFLISLPEEPEARTKTIHKKIRALLKQETPGEALKLIAACGLR
jgi:flavin reductase (DIM6/NTAB) family NADH-FMN oxidoreductase RutF